MSIESLQAKLKEMEKETTECDKEKRLIAKKQNALWKEVSGRLMKMEVEVAEKKKNCDLIAEKKKELEEELEEELKNAQNVTVSSAMPMAQHKKEVDARGSIFDGPGGVRGTLAQLTPVRARQSVSGRGGRRRRTRRRRTRRRRTRRRRKRRRTRRRRKRRRTRRRRKKQN